MNLILRIIDSDNFNPQGSNSKEFHQKGGSIGRAENNDFILSDESKTISKLHAFIHYRGDQYHLTDVSTNGVFFNDEQIPLAQTADNPRLIHAGDRIRIGNYLLTATLEDNVVLAPAEYKTEPNYAMDIEALLSGGDSEILLPKQRINMDNRYDGKFGGIELHNNLGIEDTTREAKHVAGDLNIDDFLNQGFDVTKIPSHDVSDLLDLDSFTDNSTSVAYEAPSAVKESMAAKAQRLAELANQLLVAKESDRYLILAEINRLSKI